MRRLWLALVLLGCVVGLCAATTAFQQQQMERMLVALEAVETACQQGDLSRATSLAEELAHRYERINKVSMCFIAHSDLAESQETVRLLPALIRKGGDEEIAMEIARLRAEWQHLRSIDTPLLRNIL